MSFGDSLREQREKCGKTQRQCAATIEMDATYWNKLEREAFSCGVTKATVLACVEGIASGLGAAETQSIRDALLIASGFKCPHDRVSADVLEAGGKVQVQWCQHCGAVRLNLNHGESFSEWREPERSFI